MATNLEPLLKRRAIRMFDAGVVPAEVREHMLRAAVAAPSSLNSQPYRLYWIESPGQLEKAAELCLGQSAAKTASALVVAVADLGLWKTTSAAQLQWMRETGFPEEKIQDYERKAKLAKWFYLQGWFNIFGAMKWTVLKAIHPWKVIGMAPVSKRGLFQWATKSTALACGNLMTAAEALGWNTCPMEGFDGVRLGKFLGLSRRTQEIVMVVAVGKKSAKHVDHPQWRRALDTTVTIL
ncbi:MAG TPA: nitroreductase family protein [Candidatus Eisenbacteria bacterium]|nr:nitroreductase family protein [Candidatus Eisenbacteria bacterium]